MAMKVRALFSVAAVLITMSLTGCGHYTCGTTFGNATCTSSGGGITTGGGGGTGNGLVAFGYFVDFTRSLGGIGLAKLDTSANAYLAITSFVPPVTPPFPTGIAIANKSFLYIPSGDGTLYSFAIDGTSGSVSNIGTNPTAVTGGDSVAVSASGSLLFVGDTAGQRISVYTINADGSLTVVAGSPFATSGVSPRVMVTDGLGKFLYVTSGANSIAVAAFSIGSGGVLTPVAGGLIPSNMSAIAADPSGKFLLGVSWLSGDNTVQVFAINGSTGTLTSVGSVLTSGTPRNLAVHPNGAWVYTFSEDPIVLQQEAVEGFLFDNSTGALTQMSQSPFTNIIANGGAIEQSGQYLIGLGTTLQNNFPTNTQTPYSIDSTSGALSVWPAGADSSLGFPGIDSAAFTITDAP
jgi:6-phosphogluconolactonase (cycloisomerase 2 family)